ncbi:hydantoinase/oxoprolinase family protein [Amycolatopsis sp. CA-230715]|uniref:hydantoinase/oxoprolinase family protein n=1 Tax=Amycolatopsis sp. CA-230715 TaxID=2745196 RepID=UPI001C0170C4|nr:hydantoinase/oxoprolinase family protein [Amycolatopsis sp. CA-230715]QWF85380.1 hypothetical protein HUW46_08834 [Amycolatopsis sp. CA-230715]
MSRLRIGIDVGGTNTDAVLVDDHDTVLAAEKTPTTSEPLDGIRAVLTAILDGVDRAKVDQVMLGTTHPANAVIQRRGLSEVGVLRLAAPTSFAVRPGAAWPADLRAQVLGPVAIVGGGFEYDGREIAPLDEGAIREFAARCARGGVRAVAVSGVFAPASTEHEERAADILAAELGATARISLSHEVGSLGLLERENATILNAALQEVAHRVVDGFRAALNHHDLDVDAFLTQNDGTLMAADQAARLPVLTLGSGPTNSMRGACALAGLSEAVVIDVGGTSADAGVLVDGFPRESTAAVEVGGVRTNFRMPDLISIGLGGGSVVRPGEGDVTVGPDSVGYRVAEAALTRGGDTLTLSDISAVAGRLTGFGRQEPAGGIDPRIVKLALDWVDAEIDRMTTRMKSSRHALPLIAVGGGSHLVADAVRGASRVVRPEHHAVANAYGAAIAEASGAVDRVIRFAGDDRQSSLDEARRAAADAAVAAGADPHAVRVTSLTEIPLTYVPGKASRVLVKAAGPLRTRRSR